ncbi:metal-dependent hydrolase [Haladaptatus cibarius]|uniref:metal-dependent hydrolase n=1 Tax=Haladaptatus cibarius TaxID=453847 RepID=UPI0006786518|nr:metal-dependent hydrolase [Haladaptatus cibarius]
MYRHGHLGITLLILAPISYALVQTGQFALTGLLVLGVLIIEPLPDNDHWVPGLSHRGVSHSLLTAGVIGLICAGCGWLLGRYLTVPLAHWMQTSVLPATNTTVVVIATEQLAALTPETLAGLGFVIGVLGICAHLAGDIITVSGIHPFLPFSRRRISLSRLRAASTLANTVFLLLGVLAMGTVIFALSPFAGAFP